MAQHHRIRATFGSAAWSRRGFYAPVATSPTVARLRRDCAAEARSNSTRLAMRIFIRKLILIIAVILSTALMLCGCGGDITSPDIAPHIVAATAEQAVAIDSFEQFQMPTVSGELTPAQYRERVQLLYDTVVYDGKKPVFADNDPVQPIYDEAHKFLSTYIHDDWQGVEREVNTVHAVHDWLISKTDYDFKLYQSYLGGNTDYADNPAFFIDGVLLNGKAVCDGLARTFNFLCAMEGIQSMRVTGSFSSAPHAWNKVKVDGQWYNVDVTADAVHYEVGGKSYKQIAHGFMLICDDTLNSFNPNGHDFVQTQFTAPADFDYYSDNTVNIGGKNYSRVVKNQAELDALFSAISDQKGSIGKIELKLDFAGKAQVNSADMYVTEIGKAYKNVDNAGFNISGGAIPYFRFPNGVYLFLIYK
ncbi:MAG: hypothetical protein K2K13_05985 [Clostridiales bacterium]|nr:hypothetical protein [Clostridiales bacterium]